jgi:iron-sulfur cluster assembly protein
MPEETGQHNSSVFQPVSLFEADFSATESHLVPSKLLTVGAAWFNRYNGDQGSPEKFRSNDNMVQITEKAIGKVKEIMSSQDPAPSGLRISVVGGGCSGFSYSMAFENTPNILDKTYNYDGLKIFVDQASLLYLDGAEVDFVETLEGSGFKFNNPQVKSTCGCGSSFQV